jgi:hypothetical protein
MLWRMVLQALLKKAWVENEGATAQRDVKTVECDEALASHAYVI